MHRDQQDDPIDIGNEFDVKIQLDATRGREIVGEMRISAAPSTVFVLLTDARCMMTWLAQSVEADARPGGVFRLADASGLWLEGRYLEVVRNRNVVLSWGGIDGLTRGQSIVKFTLRDDGNNTLLRLGHFNLPGPALEGHCIGWRNSGLPKLKAAAEGKRACGTCLGDAADSREQHSSLAQVIW
jgi:uncharacterized protein YndB with AHSA1/START domain